MKGLSQPTQRVHIIGGLVRGCVSINPYIPIYGKANSTALAVTLVCGAVELAKRRARRVSK